MLARVTLKIGEDNLFSRLDTITNAGTDVVVLRPLPMYAKFGTSQVTGVVSVIDDVGNILSEVMSGEIGAVASVGSFALNANGIVQIAFANGEFATTQDAIEALAGYSVVFQLQDTASYVPDAYDVQIYSRYDGSKTFDSVIIGDEQLLALMRAHISVADLQNMNPFIFVIHPKIRV